ncbi:MAG: L-lysine 2,3-aminomutase [Myxococcota bacterium]|nr:L-lysine 2,3-aminomutase [Myxococcota bacterium]
MSVETIPSGAPSPPVAETAPLLRRESIPDQLWRDWRWQFRNRITSLDELARWIRVAPEEVRGVRATQAESRMAVTPYYASLMDADDPNCPIRMQAIPREAEVHDSTAPTDDPLAEEEHRFVPGIVHRYPDRALLLVNDTCAVYCRHCMRRRLTFTSEAEINRDDVDQGVEYIAHTPAIRDVLLTGGDALSLSDERLLELLERLRRIPHLEIIRLSTRAPVTLPMRVSPELAKEVRGFAPVYMVTHFNHPAEVTAEAAEACAHFIDHGVPVLNQSVLLRGVNTSARLIHLLCMDLIRQRILPYYLHQGDLVKGSEHFRTPLSVGVSIMEELRGRIGGFAIPRLVVDLPGGGGKVPFGPDYEVRREGSAIVFRNFQGREFTYVEPPHGDAAVPFEEVYLRKRGMG